MKRKLNSLLLTLPGLLILALLALFVSNRSAREQATVETKESGPAVADSSSSPLRQRLEIGPDLLAFGRWMKDYRQAPGEADIAEGIRLAAARREALKRLIPIDPEEALAQAIPFEERDGFPVEIQQFLEVPVRMLGDFDVIATCGLDEGQASRIDRFATNRHTGDRYQAYPFGNRMNVTTKHGISIQGIAVDDVMAVADDPVRVVPESERVAGGLPENAIQVGASYFVTDNPDLIDELRSRLMADELTLGPDFVSNYRALRVQNMDGIRLISAAPGEEAPAPGAGEGDLEPSPHTEGPKKILYIRARFADQDPDHEPIGLATLQARQAGVEQFWEDNSYGKSTVTTTYTDTVTLADPTASWPQGLGTMLQQARDAALAAEPPGEDWDYNNYDFYTVVTSGGSGWGYAGVAFVGGKGSHLNGAGSTYIRTAAHEFGHNLGLLHAQYWRTDSPSPIGRDSVPGGYRGDAVNDEHIEYGHKFSTMSAQGGSGDFDSGRGHFTTGEKVRLDWLEESDGDHVSLTESATVRLYRHDIPASEHAAMTTGVARSVKISRDSDDYSSASNKRRYWLTHRWLPTNGIAETWLRRGLQIDWQRETYGGDGSILLDMTPFSRNSTTVGGNWTTDNNDKEDAALILGRTYTDEVADIHVTPIARGGTSPNQWIDVVVNLDTRNSNQEPSITNFTSSATEVGTGGSVNFSVAATDPDGDMLAYSWDFGDHSLVEGALNSTTATKSWSSAGQYVVRVTVSDMKGAIATREVVVTVGAPANVYQISGRVLHGGLPVAGARVNVSNTDWTWTGSDGTYSLVGLSPGNYTVNASKHGLTLTPQFSNPVTLSTLNAFGKDFHANEGLPGSGGLTLAISPHRIDVPIGASATFVAQGWDLAGNEVTVTPDWSVDGGGTIDSTGRFTAASEGTFTVTATEGPTNAISTVRVLNLSAVGITAVDDEASESGGNSGQVRIQRYGDTTDALSVKLTLSGSATPGVDFVAPNLSINFSSGQASADVFITPLNDFAVEDAETVIVGLAVDPDYQVLGSEATATVTILDDGDVGPEVTILSPSSIPALIPAGTSLLLKGSATDDGFPNPPGVLSARWEMLSGPDGGSVTFSPPQSFEALARFSLPGFYRIGLRVSDGPNFAIEELRVAVGVDSGTPSNVNRVIYYSFNEGSGATANDGEGGNHDGTLENGPTWMVPGQSVDGGAIRFDGDDDHVSIADSSDINSGSFPYRTVAFWFKAGNPGRTAKQVLYEEGGGTRGLNVYLEQNVLYVGGWNNNENGWDETFRSAPLEDTDWHHVALVLDAPFSTNGLFTAYLDGFRFGSSGAGALNSHTGDIGIGAMNDGTRFHDGTEGGDGFGFVGRVDEFQLWNRALSATEISQLFTAFGDVGPGLTLSTGREGGNAVVIPNSVGLVLDGVMTSPDSPTVGWSSLVTPSGATVSFGDDSVASTTARFSDPGYYQLRLTAANGGITTGVDLHVHAGIDSSANPSATSQVVYFPLNEGSGLTAGDTIGGDNNGTLTNGPTWTAATAGVSGSALSFDGVDDVVAIDNAPGINTSSFNQRVISLWFRATDPGADGKEMLFEEGGGTRGLNLYLEDGLLYFGGWNGNLNGWGETYLSTPVSAGEWNHAVLVLDAPAGGSLVEDGFRGYLNGVLIGSGQGAEMDSHTGNIGLGGMRDSTRAHDGSESGDGNYFSGLIDEFHLWTGRVLTMEEIGALYSFGNIGPFVDAGVDVAESPEYPNLPLDGGSSDDGRWTGTLTHEWSVVSAPAPVTFGSPDGNGVDRVATVSAGGDHVFRLTANDGDIATFDEVTITAVEGEPYDVWSGGYPELTEAELLPGANPDGDDLINLEEYAFGTDPTQVDVNVDGLALSATGVAVVALNEEHFEFQYRRRIDHEQLGLIYELEFSPSMEEGTWSSGGLTEVGTSGIDALFEWVTVRVDAVIESPSDRGFGRVRLSLAE